MTEQDEYIMKLMEMKDRFSKQKIAALEIEVRLAKIELDVATVTNTLKQELDDLIIYRPHEN